jgi:4-hydroxybenzoate polyprenyltransferase
VRNGGGAATAGRPWARAAAGTVTAGAFIRCSALGVTVFFLLLGAASAGASPDTGARPPLALAVVALAFHVYAYVGNDVVDLPIDRTAPARGRGPLVRGTVRPGTAAVVAAVQVPVAAVAAGWGGGTAAVLALLAACLLMLVYNLWGKRTPVPQATDLVQGLGWAALTLTGAFIAGRPGPATGWLLAFITFYIVLANGVHGSIRDVRNDLRHQVRSTAILLGTRPGPGRSLTVPAVVARYAYTLQALLTCLALAAPIARHERRHTALGTTALTLAVAALVCVAGFAVLRAALRCTADERLLWAAGALHLIVTLLLPLVFLAADAPRRLVYVLVVLYIVPFLLNGWIRKVVQWGWWRHRTLREPGAAESGGGRAGPPSGEPVGRPSGTAGAPPLRIIESAEPAE